VKIGLSYTMGSPKYRLYVGALLAAAERYGIDAQPQWLASPNDPVNRALLETMDGLILTGGADVAPSRYGFADPERVCEIAPGRDEAEWEILAVATLRRIPTLAICRGLQLLNVFHGGTLVPHLASTEHHRLEDTDRHPVAIEPDSALALLTGVHQSAATSSHHQAADVLGNGLRIAARHADGTIEAIEWIDPMRKPWLAAVQWHPERMGLDEPLAGPLYRGFLEAVAVTR
jgi:putative glutamine amidotransferase